MLRIVKNTLCVTLLIICLTAITFCFVSCASDYESNYVFKFGTPEGFDVLSPEEQLEWAKANGYFVMTTVYGKHEVFNEEALNAFLQNACSAKEQTLFIMTYYISEKTEAAEVRFTGVYFDGESYHATFQNINTLDRAAIGRYKYCGIEEYRGVKYLCVSNDNSLTVEDEFRSHFWSDSEKISEFAKKHFTVVVME